jgi:hypothetical protein
MKLPAISASVLVARMSHCAGASKRRVSSTAAGSSYLRRATIRCVRACALTGGPPPRRRQRESNRPGQPGTRGQHRRYEAAHHRGHGKRWLGVGRGEALRPRAEAPRRTVCYRANGSEAQPPVGSPSHPPGTQQIIVIQATPGSLSPSNACACCSLWRRRSRSSLNTSWRELRRRERLASGGRSARRLDPAERTRGLHAPLRAQTLVIVRRQPAHELHHLPRPCHQLRDIDHGAMSALAVMGRV